MIRKPIKHFFHKALSRKEFSTLWEVLYRISLKGLNYGYCDSPKNSGEKCVIKMLKKRTPVNGHSYTLVNVGANYGQCLSLFEQYITKYQGILFEPSIVCFKDLLEHKRENVEIYNLALGAKEETSELYYDTEGSVQSSLLKSFNQKSQTIKVTTLDIALEENVQIDLLVIDTEGFEKNVLLGAQKMISENRIQMIQFEHGSMSSILNKTFLKDFFEILDKYEIYHIKQNGIKKIKYSTEKEIFYNTNYLAILR